MATVTKSIGTSSRDYSTITAWEADLDDTGIYNSSDVAVGECYDDSDFDEFVTIDGGGTVGLASRELTASTKHDGTAGSGAIIKMTSGGLHAISIAINDTDVSWMEVDGNGQTFTNGGSLLYMNGSNSQRNGRNCILHDITCSRGVNGPGTIGSGSENVTVMNCFIYDVVGGNDVVYGIRAAGGASAHCNLLNNTVYKVDNNGIYSNNHSYGMQTPSTSGTKKMENNIIMSVGGSSPGNHYCQSDTNSLCDYNFGSDSTIEGTNSLASKTLANVDFISTTAGAEDLRLDSSSQAIDEGVDLVTTPTNVNIDIAGRDRDAGGDTWDIGAHEYVAAGGATPNAYRPLLGLNVGA